MFIVLTYSGKTANKILIIPKPNSILAVFIYRQDFTWAIDFP
jgi:hypothetical protein